MQTLVIKQVVSLPLGRCLYFPNAFLRNLNHTLILLHACLLLLHDVQCIHVQRLSV